jgi:hypothetical protein
VSTCAPPPPPDRLAPLYEREAPTHTKKILISIAKLTELMTLPITIPKLSPFTICMLATAIIAHLSACRYVLNAEELDLARERIRVNIGTLETFSEVWPRASKTVKEVRIIAKDILRERSTSSTTSGSPSSATISVQGRTSDTSGSLSSELIESYPFSVPYFQDPSSLSGFDSGFDPALAALFNLREAEGLNDIH